MVPRSKILGCLGWSLWAGSLASLVILLFSYGPSPHDGNLGKVDEHGKSWIDYLTPEQVAKLEYWDVEEKRP